MPNNLMKTEEFARYCQTTRDTLHLYDKMGILIPRERSESGYRYYDVEQYYDFDLISTLKASGCTLKEVQEYYQNYDLDRLSSFFAEKRQRLAEEIKTAQKRLKYLTAICDCLSEVDSCRFHTPELVSVPEELQLLTPIPPEFRRLESLDNDSLRAHISKTIQLTGGQCYPHGIILDGSKFLSGTLSFLQHFYPVEGLRSDQVLPRAPGLYLRYYLKGEYASLVDVSDQISSFLTEQGLTPGSYVYVYDMITALSCLPDEELILKILIPIKE